MPQPWKHPSSGVYYLRKKVPQPLIGLLGREYKRSLGTANLAEAKRLFPQALMVQQEAFEMAQAQLAGTELLSDGDIEQLAIRWYGKAAAQAEIRKNFGDWLERDNAQLDDGTVVPAFRPLREGLEDDDDEAILDRAALRHAAATLKAEGLLMPVEQSPAWLKLRATFRSYLLKLSDLAYQRVQGNWDATANAPAVVPLQVKASRQRQPEEAGLMSLFEGYAKDKRLNDGDNRSTKKTLASYQRIVAQFTELCGDMPLSAIDRDVIQKYRELVSQLPNMGAGTRGQAALKSIEAANAQNLPRLSAATVRNKLLALSAVFSYGVRMAKVTENPVQASGISRAAKKAAFTQASRKRRRKHYTREEIERVFQSAIYTEGWRSPDGKFGEAWYWMPLLMYYTGARREELAQAYVRDVKAIAGPSAIPTLSVLATDDDDEGRGVKTEGSRRIIPLHQDLIERGLFDYVSSLPLDGLLFPLLKPNSMGFYGATFGKHWGRFVRTTLGIDSVAPAHGFRHTFKTICREVGIPEDVSDAITGHTGSSVAGRGYGEMPLIRMAQELEKYPKPLRDSQEHFPPDLQGL